MSPTLSREAALTKVQTLVDENGVMLFSKTYCPYCRNTKQILDGAGAKYKTYELDVEDDGSVLQQALLELTGQRTVPSIFIGKKHIGGNSDLSSKSNKELEALLKDANALL